MSLPWRTCLWVLLSWFSKRATTDRGVSATCSIQLSTTQVLSSASGVGRDWVRVLRRPETRRRRHTWPRPRGRPDTSPRDTVSHVDPHHSSGGPFSHLTSGSWVSSFSVEVRFYYFQTLVVCLPRVLTIHRLDPRIGRVDYWVTHWFPTNKKRHPESKRCPTRGVRFYETLDFKKLVTLL